MARVDPMRPMARTPDLRIMCNDCSTEINQVTSLWSPLLYGNELGAKISTIGMEKNNVNLRGKQRQEEELPASLLFSFGGKLDAPSTQACPLIGPSCHLAPASSQPQLGSRHPSFPLSIPSCHPPLTIHLIHLSETSQQ